MYHNPPYIKSYCKICTKRWHKVHLLVGEPSSLDSVRANKEARADDDGAGGDKRPEVLAHLPEQESGSRSPFTQFQSGAG